MRKPRILLSFLFVAVLAISGCGGGGGGGDAATTSPVTPEGVKVAAGITVSPTTIITDESGSAATISVSLNSKPRTDVTIPVASSDTSEGTVDKTSLVFTARNWNIAQPVTITGVNDDLADGTQSYDIILGAAVSTDKAYNGLRRSFVANNRDVRTASFVVSDISGNTSEAGSSATFTVRLGSQPTTYVTIAVTSSDPSEGTVDKANLTFSTDDWNTDQTVTVTGVGDLLADGNVPYTINLGVSTSADSTYNGIDPKDVAVTNTEVPASAGFIISSINGSTSESGATATFTVRLFSQPTANVTIPVTSSDTTEGTVSPASLTFTNSNWNTDQTVTVTGVSDNLADGNVPYTIYLGLSTSTDGIYNNINPVDVAVTNTDVRAAASFIISGISGNTSESGTTATFTVRLGSQPTANVTIPVSSSDTSEGTVIPASLTFTNTNWNTDRTVTVTGVNDALADGNVAYSILLGSTSSTDSLYNNLDPNDVSVTNIDVRTASFVVSAISGNTSESGTSASFTVHLGSAPSADVIIPVQSSDTSEGTVDKGSLTFTKDNWNTDQTVTVTGVSDSLADGSITYPIQLGPTASTDSVYDNKAPGEVSVTNLDAKIGLVDFTFLGGNTNESGSQVTFQVKLHSQPTADVTIPVSSSDTSEGTVDKAILTFTDTNWNQYQTVTVTGVDDPLADGNVDYTIQLGLSSSTDNNYSGLDPADIGLTNIDMKTGSLEVTTISGATDESGLTANFQVRLNSQPAYDVNIPVSSSNTGEGTVDKTSLTFTSGNWSTYQTVTVTGVTDNIPDGDTTYDIQLGSISSTDDNYNGLNPSDVAVTNLDVSIGSFDITAISGDTDEAGQQATFQVRLGTQPTAAVTIAVSSSDESEGTVDKATLTFTDITWSTYQTVTVTGVDDNLADGNQSYSVTLGPANSTDGKYSGLDPADVGVINIDLVDPYAVTPAISAGSAHNLLLASDGTVWGWGTCGDNQLDATPATCPDEGFFGLPKRLNITGATAVSAGLKFSAIARKADGSVWTSGDNQYSQLGHASSSALTKVDGLTGVKTLAAGTYHTLALKNDGSVWAWGMGGSGQLGNGLILDSQTPVQAAGGLTGKTLVAITAGGYHSLALDNTGKVYSWGSDGYGQLGLGAGDQTTSTPTVINSLSGVTAIATGYRYSFAVGFNSAFNRVDTWGWGDNSDQQIGGTTAVQKQDPQDVTVFTNTIQRLDGGLQHSLALMGSTVYAWGDNDHTIQGGGDDGVDSLGALGNNTKLDVQYPQLQTPSFLYPTGHPPAMDLSTGDNHSVVLLDDGRLLASGVGTLGQLGTNESLPAITYVYEGQTKYIYDHTLTPVYVEDPGDPGAGTSYYFYAYRPILSGQPATSTSSTSARITVCSPDLVAPANCGPITYYMWSDDQGTTWNGPDPISTPINLSGLSGTVNLWVKGMSSISNAIQTDASAVKVSWEVIAK